MPVLFEAPAKGAKATHKPVGIKAKHTHSMGPLTAYAVNPTGVRFETQEAEEQIMLFLLYNVSTMIIGIIPTYANLSFMV